MANSLHLVRLAQFFLRLRKLPFPLLVVTEVSTDRHKIHTPRLGRDSPPDGFPAAIRGAHPILELGRRAVAPHAAQVGDGDIRLPDASVHVGRGRSFYSESPKTVVQAPRPDATRLEAGL